MRAQRVGLVAYILIILFAWLFLLFGCKATRDSNVRFTHVVKFDSLHLEKHEYNFKAIQASQITDDGFRFIMNKDRPKIKPGQPILEYAAENASSIKYDNYIKKDTAAKVAAISISVKNERSLSDSTAKIKLIQKKSDSTLGANIPWYVWVILSSLAGIYLFMRLYSRNGRLFAGLIKKQAQG